jgi:hypothetical protein
MTLWRRSVAIAPASQPQFGRQRIAVRADCRHATHA